MNIDMNIYEADEMCGMWIQQQLIKMGLNIYLPKLDDLFEYNLTHRSNTQSNMNWFGSLNYTNHKY